MFDEIEKSYMQSPQYEKDQVLAAAKERGMTLRDYFAFVQASIETDARASGKTVDDFLETA